MSRPRTVRRWRGRSLRAHRSGMLMGFRFVFFFQAEDGIRDGHVTGVQTCALPICRGSRYGIDGPILETSLGSIGTVLEGATREAGRRKPEVRNAASGAGAIEPRAAGAQERFSRCRTSGQDRKSVV